MKLYHLVTGAIAVNTYFLVNDENQAIVIDAGETADVVLSFAKEKGFRIKYCLLTHGHYDHALSALDLQRQGVKVYISDKDSYMLSSKDNMAYAWGLEEKPTKPDACFKDGDVLSLLGFSVKVMETAGHTKGSCCFIVEDALFSGDTLFCESIGRTDLPSGNLSDMRASLKKLLALDVDYRVYTGHGEFTSISYEKRNNPYAQF